jgi:hypothetical protein
MKAYFDHENIHLLGGITASCGFDWVAHASRVRVIASSRSRTCPVFTNPQMMMFVEKDCFGATPARDTRALPITLCEEPDFTFNFEQEQEQEKE